MAPVKFTVFTILLLGTLVQSKFADILSDYVSKLVEKLPSQVSEYPDYGLDIYGFLEKYGYPYEIHHITTEDGYILTAQRISRTNNNTNQSILVEHKPAIILQHGLLSCSMDFINRGPGQSIGLMLADAGWDVWLTNNRGNRFSRNHTTLNPDEDIEFWDFSWEECGRFDVTANIDYILKETGHQKVAYIGHSQGTTQFFVMGAMRPEYNDKISVMAALAPVAYMGNMASPLFRLMAQYINILEPLLVNVFHLYELLPSNNITVDLAKAMCNPDSEYGEVCAFMLFLICGFNHKEMDRSFIPYVAFNDPAGISSKMIIHYGQEINSGFFRRYDLGQNDNLRKYKVATPPHYNVSAITAPIALYYSRNDLLAAVKDVEQLAGELPNVVNLHIMEDKYFSHIDFIWAKDVATTLNNDLVTFLANHTDPNDIGGSGTRNYGSLYLLISVICCALLSTVNLV